MSKRPNAEIFQSQNRLREDLAIQEKLDNWVEQNPLQHFIPTGKQCEAIAQIAGDSFITIFSAANGTGKTTLLASVLGSVIFGSSRFLFCL